MTTMKNLPKTIFVKIEHSDKESYLVASTEKYGLAEQGEKLKVGTYQLVETETIEMVLKSTPAR